MADFNKIYSGDKNAWGMEVSPILINALKYIKRGLVLDIGCGQGKETIYLANKGFDVVALDSSSVAIDQIKEIIKKNKLKNIRAVNSDIIDFEIKKNAYDLILCFNVLYFLEKSTARRIVKKIQEGMKKGGIIAMSLFTVHDTFYNEQKKHRFYVETNEVRGLFENFEILDYFEGIINEPRHASYPDPHTHGVVKIVAKN